ncbi:hypothetical protein SAMN05428966_11882 [Massilia sp. PDC64]|nr:hypothetical protein [Massilia sp. PDC64]SDF64708.1 hypothetical protein SAMN05428966_11882 [Massilia sp. PDC64]
MGFGASERGQAKQGKAMLQNAQVAPAQGEVMQEIAGARAATRVCRIDPMLGVTRFGNDVRAQRRQLFQ